MDKLIGLGIIGAAVLIASGVAQAQVYGAVQYPPASVGTDARPPPPAGMVPQIVSPRRIELGISGSSQSPAGYPARARPWTDNDRLQSAPPPVTSPMPFPSVAGN